MVAEQLFKSGKIKDRKKYVQDWLEERNIKIDPEEIDALIEAMVYELKNGG